MTGGGQLGLIVHVLFEGAIMTAVVTAGGFVVSVALGLVSAGFATSRSALLRTISYIYVEVFRAVPILTQLFIIYFGLGSIGIRLSPIPAALIGFGLNGGANLTELFRSGIGAIDAGQTEAALSIGMTRLMAMRHIVLPQAVRIVLPSLTNFSIGLLKDTSLASAVAAPELSFNANMLVERTFRSTEIYIALALFYLAMSLPLVALARRLEHYAKRGGHA